MRTDSTLLAIVMSGLIATASVADTISVDFRDTPSAACGSPWLEDGVPCELVSTVDSDCPGPPNCNTGVFGTGITLGPARLVVDLTGVSGLETANVYIREYDAALTIRARLVDAGGGIIDEVPSYQQALCDLELDAQGQVAATLVVSGCNADLNMVELHGASITPVETDTWGKIKAMYGSSPSFPNTPPE